MSLKKFGNEDLIYTTIVANPQYTFLVQSGSVYRNNEILPDGNFSNKINHIKNGEISFHEINVNRPSDSLVYGFISKDTSRYAFSTVSTSNFNDSSQFQFGNEIKQEYPLKAGLTRIWVPAGAEFDTKTFDPYNPPSQAGSNKKYIRALTNVINSRDHAGSPIEYGDLGTKKVNMVCIPAIFYGSTVEKGSIELDYYITGSLAGKLIDKNKDGMLIQSTGAQSGSVGGLVIYEQGIMLLTGSWDLSEGDNTQAGTFGGGIDKPSWLAFGTGLPLVGAADALNPDPDEAHVLKSTFSIKFRGTNRIPTITMITYANKGELNYSNNPTFLVKDDEPSRHNSASYEQPKKTIKNITKSIYDHHSASYESTTFISKVGIYDENKNLIAIATLANPLKKTPSRDYMIKLRMDF